MKPTSVIFLIVSVLLACLGVILCMTATSIANEQGIGLFDQVGDGDDNYVHYETFAEEELKKIVVRVSDVKVNVIGGAEESKIELRSRQAARHFRSPTTQVSPVSLTLRISRSISTASVIISITFLMTA